MNGKTNTSFFETVTKYTSRLICLGSLIGFGLIVADFAVPLIRTSSQKMPPNTPAEQPNLFMGIAEGYWSFADSDLTVQRLVVSPVELESRLNALSADTAATTTFDASRLVELAKMGGAKLSHHQAGAIWSHEAKDIQIRLITTNAKSNASKTQLIAAAFATRQNDDWHLTMLRPVSLELTHLLSFDANAQTVCSRRSETGRVQMQLVSTAESSTQLLERWLSDGWQIERTEWGSSDGFSYLCRRNDEAVYAWSERDNGLRTIMLTSAGDPRTKSKPY